MSKKSRAYSTRTHRHTDFSVDVETRDEAFLFELLKSSERPPLLLVLDHVQDPHNLGACLRTADGAGVDAVIVAKDRSAHITESVRTVACGAAESVPLVQVTNLARLLDQLKDRHVWVVGTSDKAAKAFYEADLTGPIAIVMGSEGKGLRRLTAEKCDFLVSLPMHGKVTSLNVSVATGICLYEAVRQRRAKTD
jgi:23S rRNA (guanosine2251-2'-O)-methyltransferase